MDVQNIASNALKLPTVATPSIAPAKPNATDEAGAADKATGFGKALMNAIEGLDAVQKSADDKAMELATGEPIDLHEVMLSRETASLHMQLALQVRNKLVEAYQDVMRMQI